MSRGISEFWTRFRRNRGAVVGLAFFALFVAAATAGPFLFPGDPWKLAGRPLSPPLHNGFLLGTDSLGRDIALGIVHGARVSLVVGVISTLIAMALGAFLGALAGYYRGPVDDAIMRLTEFFQTIPSFILAVLLVAIFRPSLEVVVVTIAIVSWPPVARLVRSEFLSLQTREFVAAARILGQSNFSIIVHEILPNALPPIIVMGSLMIATSILFEAALSFLGLGDPNLMSWGYMIGVGRSIIRIAWWASVFPGLAIFLTVLSINLVGEGVTDALNPRLSRKGRA